jgi:hypothetical protein
VAPQRSGMQHIDLRNAATGDARGQAAADGLDLWELGHVRPCQRAAAGPVPREGFSAAKAMAAAFCSASFLFRPAPGP